MEFKKSLVSFLLLFVYTIGFAHDFIPHYHIEDIHFGIGNNERHSHLSVEDDFKNEVNHGDHLDAGVYDYLVCAFSEANHSNHDDVNAVSQNLTSSIVSQNELPFVEIKFLESDKIGLKSNVKVSSTPFRDNSTDLSSRSNRRGPPLFS